MRGLRTLELRLRGPRACDFRGPGDLQIESAAEFRVVIEGKPRPLLSAARTEVYLIAREAISNALRHAQARTIEVTLEYLPDSFRLTVRDDGRGFVAGTASADRAVISALSVMSERAERLAAPSPFRAAPERAPRSY